MLYAIKSFANIVINLVAALCVVFVLVFIYLAYREPMTLDSLAHQAHYYVPMAIDGFIANIKSLF